MKEKQAVKCGGEGANTSAEHRNPSFNARDDPFFYFFQNICFQFQGSSKLDSIFECFSSRYVTGEKEEEREQKRGEGKRRGDGRKRGRKTKETARGGKSRTQWRE